MDRIGILASDNMMPGELQRRVDSFEGDEQFQRMDVAFRRQQMQPEVIRWREAARRACEFEAYLPLFVWDYFEGNEAAFLDLMKQSSQQTLVCNSCDLLCWNADKSYLQQLADHGAPVIVTRELKRVTEHDVQQAFDDLQTETLVIKPKVGGGAWRQVLYERGTRFPSSDQLPPEEALVQPFLPAVVEEGEYSFLFFDGQFSHGLLKKPKAGDYRIQSMYGGTETTYQPTESELETARRVLAALDEVPLYARVDLLRGLDGELKLIELELIEPYLYMPHATEQEGRNQAAEKLALALRERLQVR